ncbi:MAG: heterodisulfide reductase-related iron-sulfur binding cluster [Coriobacteriaceae bacterium]|nr:heterodisulfide reductase-related iron-sulfur binding cluster [Coriobacteriaceae bacterium]
MKNYAYFPGCSAESTGLSFTKSTKYVTDRIGFKMTEIPDWNCCGTSAAKLTNHELGQALSARNLAIAEQMEGSPDVVAPCAGCYQALQNARRFVRESDANRARIEEIIEQPYEGKARVVSLLEAFADEEVTEAVKAAALKPLRGLKVACYYGCTIVRPVNDESFDDAENPQSMDELLRAVGAEPVDWAFKTECCSGSQSVAMPGIAHRLIDRIFENAAANGAECIATTCPLCQLNLDMRVAEINKMRVARGLEPFDIPVYYFTELIGAAMGGRADELGTDIHFYPAREFLMEAELRGLQIAAEERKAAEEAARKEAERAAKIAAAQAARAKKAKPAEETPKKKPAAKPAPAEAGATYKKPQYAKEERALRNAQEALAAKQAELQAARNTADKLREELAQQAEELARVRMRADARAAFENMHDDASGHHPDHEHKEPAPEGAEHVPGVDATHEEVTHHE